LNLRTWAIRTGFIYLTEVRDITWYNREQVPRTS
jgi:hypothetical protein